MILLRPARLGLALVLALACPGAAAASQLIDRGATAVRLVVGADGSAYLSYRAHGKALRVRAAGARNALAPSRARPQVSLSIDFSGDLGRGRGGGRGNESVCRLYDGPPLHWLVAACKAPDGSYWAVQSWQRGLADYGTGFSNVPADLRLSHWRGPLASLYVNVDWAYGGRADHLYGAVSYLGGAVFGFHSSRFGAPLDSYGRSVYLDTNGSAYGSGWRRENSFLTHRPTGYFCYGLFPHGKRPAGKGTEYRATTIGPGVTPDLFWQGGAPGPYDRAVDGERNTEQLRLGGADQRCRTN